LRKFDLPAEMSHAIKSADRFGSLGFDGEEFVETAAVVAVNPTLSGLMAVLLSLVLE
jgi:hypothetical protein